LGGAAIALLPAWIGVKLRHVATGRRVLELTVDDERVVVHGVD
jgi:hypothetical protein